MNINSQGTIPIKVDMGSYMIHKYKHLLEYFQKYINGLIILHKHDYEYQKDAICYDCPNDTYDIDHTSLSIITPTTTKRMA